jgi:hypothetical protein
MKQDDHYLERTPDLIAQIRALREQMQKQRDRFTRAEDYDVRRAVGHGPAPGPVSPENAKSSPVGESASSTSVPDQTDLKLGEEEIL